MKKQSCENPREREEREKTLNEKRERKEQRGKMSEKGCYVRSQSTSSQGDDDWC